jgi:hypothetical protein
MRVIVGLAAVVTCLLAFAGSVHAGLKPISGAAPIGLRGFLLRADETKLHVDSFARTPSFAWSPVRGAQRYEFELSTSSTFRENAVVYADPNVRSPAAAVPISLPWITGKPYSLYARVRAVLRTKITPWSEPYGFNMTPPPPPQPLSTYPGLLRWSTVDGATRYDIWLLEARKVFSVNTNVADQREYYTFHQGVQWTSSVNWRVRAVRTLYGERKNGLPAVSYGAWSPVYTAVNPPFVLGELDLSATVSDVISDDSEATRAHGLMPGFAYAGNTSIFNTAEELYRVYVFTDKGCLNLVYRGAIVGSPAYAPRPLGPLALPQTQADLIKARSSYMRDGAEGKTYAADGVLVKTTESDPPAESSGSKSDEGSKGGGSGSNGDTSEGAAATGAQAGSGTSIPKEQTKAGAPVDLWDTDHWPQGGYWWTSVPVEVVPPDEFETVLVGAAAKGATTIELAAVAGLVQGDSLSVGIGSNIETVKVLSIAGSTVTLSTALVNTHASDEPVERPGKQLVYRDTELTQEACEKRQQRFGKQSAPALVANGAPFASGLSPTGRLIAASESSAAFYGPPLVAWAPALGADAYEVQWSKTAYPFRPQANGKSGGLGLQTFATSATLPLKPGTWYYRVRGINFSVPGGANQMSWSNSVRLVVTKPRFVVIP